LNGLLLISDFLASKRSVCEVEKWRAKGEKLLRMLPKVGGEAEIPAVQGSVGKELPAVVLSKETLLHNPVTLIMAPVFRLAICQKF
jgi:hypothetical protein